MRFLLKLIAGLFVLLTIAALVAPMFLKGAWVKSKVETAATEALGREVTIIGTPEISILPTKVSLEGLRIANAEGFTAPLFLNVGEANISVRLLPLLRQQVEITAFNLDQPTINLEAKEDGRVNWVLGAATPPSNGAAKPISDIKLGTVRITNGNVNFQNATDVSYTADNADIVITLKDLQSTLSIAGTMRLQGEATTLKAKLTTPRQFLEGRGAAFALNMRVGENSAETTLTINEGLRFTGDLDVDIPALRALIALTGTQIDTPNGFQNVRLKGPVKGDMGHVSFLKGTELSFDQITGNGAVKLDFSKPVIKITGALAVNTLDMTPYLPAESAEMAAVKKNQGASFPPWSDEVMDFTALSAIDANLNLTANSIILPTMTIDRSDVNITIADKRLVARVNDMQLFDGRGAGEMVMNLRRAQPSMSANFSMNKINIGEFARQALGMTRLKGSGDMTMNITTAGATQKEWVGNLSGKSSARLDNGRLEGVNLGKIARGSVSAYTSFRDGGLNIISLQQAFSQLTTTAKGDAEATDFNALLIDLTINKGIVKSDKFTMTGPYFEITGDALVNLLGQTMRMTLTPIASVNDGEEKRSLPVPILISGSFNQPKVGVDAGPLANSLAIDALGGLLKKQGIEVSPDAGNVEDVLRDAARDELGKLLRGNNDEEDDAEKSGDANADASDDADDPATEVNQRTPDPKDELINLGLNALFGTSSSDEDTAEEPTEAE